MAENEWYPPEPPDLPDGDRLIVNFETTGLDWRGGAKPLAVAVHQPASGRSWYLPFGHRGPRNFDEEQVRRWAREQFRNRRIDNANTKFELHMGRSWGVDLDEAGCTFGDVQHYAALLDDHRKTVNFDDLVRTELGEQPMARLDESRMAEWRSQDAAPRAMYGVEAVERILKTFRPRLAAEELEQVAALEDAVIPAVVEMEHNGAPLDVAKCERWQREARAERDDIRREVAKAVGRKLQESLFDGGRDDSGFVNKRSSKEMAKLYESFGLTPERNAPTKKNDQGSLRFDAEALSIYADHPVIALLIRQGKLEDLDTKYFVPYLKHVNGNGILPVNLHQTRGDENGTRRGRFSATAPNIQAVLKPKKQKQTYGPGYVIRELFLPARGRMFVSSDAAQIEYRIFAHLARNAAVLAAYAAENPHDPLTWLDFHEQARIMIAAFLDVDRDKAKTLNFLCMEESTPILKADLSWAPAGSLKAGDKLLAFDEHRREGAGREKVRRWRVSTVLENAIIERECLEIELANGDKLTCNPEHRWLCYRNADRVSLDWVRSDELKVGVTRILKCGTPWVRDESWEAGWLAGFMDGEGNASKQNSISLGQNKGPALDFAERLLRSRYGDVTRSDYDGKASRLGLNGDVYDRMRFLGTHRPMRLITDFVRHLDGKTFQMEEAQRVVAVRQVGVKRIAALGTSSATYIANGYAAHNTIYGGGLSKLALQLGLISKRQHAELEREYKDKQYGVPRSHPLLKNALKIKEAYEKALPEVKSLSKLARELAADRGFVKDWLGRRARFINGKGGHGALNAVIQPGAAEVMKFKMVEVHKRRRELGVTPRMTIHDDWLGDCDGPESVKKLSALMNEQTCEFRVKILWDVRASWTNWAACGKVEDQVKPEPEPIEREDEHGGMHKDGHKHRAGYGEQPKDYKP